MRFVDIIEKKKQHEALTEAEMRYFINGYVAGTLPDYQISALLMAIYFNGMNEAETTVLTQVMMESGDILDLSMLPGVVCDKHSTGGVGDKTSLALAPMVAACGAYIAKMSGRGLGHTGGTLDKLESIHGFSVHMNKALFIRQVQDIHIAIMGQSPQLVPADQKLYALRDVSATVDSLPLIASSIMSKKLACGSHAILLDVKYGEGAFMPTPAKAIELAKCMIGIGKRMGKDVRAILTDMNQPLGNAIGNALEVKEAVETLQGNGPADFEELCLKAGSIMLMQAKLANDEMQAQAMLRQTICDGSALRTFLAMVKAQGGDIGQIYDLKKLPQAKYTVTIKSQTTGYIHKLHAQRLGRSAMRLGAGRAVKEDPIDYSAGIVLQKKAGDFVKRDESLAIIHTNHSLDDAWIRDFYQCFEIQKEPKDKVPLIYGIYM